MRTLLLSACALACMYLQPIYAGSGAPCPPVDVKSKGKLVILPGVEQPKTNSAYFLQNISDDNVTIDHPKKDPGASAGFSSMLDSHHWSALQINKQNFPISCTKQAGGKTVNVDCKKVLVVCVPPKLELNPKDQGVFWLAQNKELDALLKDLTARGVKVN